MGNSTNTGYDINILRSKLNTFNANRHRINAITLASYEKDFELTFTHNSTAIEGNTLTLLETKAVLEDGISIGGKELREIYEVVNHKKAYRYVKKCIAEQKELDEKTVKDIHAILMDNIMVGGIYRNQPVRISGAGHMPPSGNAMYVQVKAFFSDIPFKRELMDPIEFAAWTHGEFVRIHPFIDGNGRTSRLLMNYQLMEAGFLPVSIDKRDRLEYYEALEKYAVEGNVDCFAGLIGKLEERELDMYIGLL